MFSAKFQVERRSCHLSLKSVVLEKWKMLSPSRASISKAIRTGLEATLQFVNNLSSSALAYALVHPMCTYNLPRSLLSAKASPSPSSPKRVFPLSRDDFQGKRAKRLTSCTFDRKENHFPENIKTLDALKTNNSAHWYIIQSNFFHSSSQSLTFNTVGRLFFDSVSRVWVLRENVCLTSREEVNKVICDYVQKYGSWPRDKKWFAHSSA